MTMLFYCPHGYNGLCTICVQEQKAAAAAKSCCSFHGSGGTFDLTCGDDLTNEKGRHRWNCVYHRGADCNCGADKDHHEVEDEEINAS